MKLVKNYKEVLLKAHSMWAVYLGILSLAVPELWYYLFGYQLVSPYLLGYLGILLLIYGGFGRIIDQGMRGNDGK